MPRPFHDALTLGEFFSGPGGMALGAEMAAKRYGVETVDHSWAVDFDPDACRTYSRNILRGEREIIPRDVTQIDMKDLSPVDLFLFGFPCNDFSTVGESKGLNGSFGKLYRYGIDYISNHRPMAFLAENVSGILHRPAGGRSAFDRIVEEMADAGYRIHAHLYKLEQYGIPQARHRVFIVGIRDGVKADFQVPAPTTEYPARQVSCRSAIECPPIASDATNNEMPKQSSVVSERLGLMRPGENVWEAMNRGALPERLKIKDTGASMSQIYRKLNPDLPSYTITGSGGGGTYVYHWKEPRALTNRERARLQTFPDGYEFLGGVADVRRQIGMAVPPKAADIVIGALIAAMQGKPLEARVSANLETRRGSGKQPGLFDGMAA